MKISPRIDRRFRATIDALLQTVFVYSTVLYTILQSEGLMTLLAFRAKMLISHIVIQTTSDLSDYRYGK